MLNITPKLRARLSALAIVVVAQLGAVTGAGAAIVDNLVGHWTFDGNYNDSSFVGNNGIGQGTPSAPAFVSGMLGQAVDLVGTNSVRTQANLETSGNQARTLNVWFNADSSQTKAAVSFGTTTTGGLFDVYLRTSDSAWGGHFYGGGYDTLSGSNPTYAAGTWTMATFVYAGATAVDVYKDGQYFKTATIPAALNTALTPMFFGTGNYVPTAGFDGKVDDVALWNRPLSAAEIQSVYNAALQGHSLFVPPPPSPLAVQFDAFAGAGTVSGNMGPGHAVGVMNGGTWNEITGQFTGTVNDENGSSLAGPVTIQFAGYGANEGNVGTLTNWGTAAVYAFAGTNKGWGGIYDTALTKDSLYLSPRNVMGTRISGLEAGTYDVFFVRGTAAPAMKVAIGANLTELTGNAFNTPGFQGSTTNNTWVEGTSLQGGNYFRKRVTISGPTDNIAVITDVVGYNYNDFLGLQVAKVADPTPPTLFRTQFDAGTSVGAVYGPAGPGHALGLFTGNQWNALGASSTGSYTGNFVDENGNPLLTDSGAPLNLTVQMAANNGASPLSNWGSVSIDDWAGMSGNAGVNNTDLMRDALYANLVNRNVMGVRIGGLPVGVYEVLMMPKYAGSTSPQSVSIGVNINSLDGSLLSPAGSSDTWVEGTATQAGNYYRGLLTINGPADWITMIYDNTGYPTTEFMGFQIARVGVPEPSAWVLLGIGFLGLVVPAWRQRRRRR